MSAHAVQAKRADKTSGRRTKSRSTPHRIGRAVALLFGVATVALVVTRSELARTYYAHRGDLSHQLDAGATAPRYGVPHLLYVVNMATLGVAVVGIVVWVVASAFGRRIKDPTPGATRRA